MHNRVRLQLEELGPRNVPAVLALPETSWSVDRATAEVRFDVGTMVDVDHASVNIVHGGDVTNTEEEVKDNDDHGDDDDKGNEDDHHDDENGGHADDHALHEFLHAAAEELERLEKENHAKAHAAAHAGHGQSGHGPDHGPGAHGHVGNHDEGAHGAQVHGSGHEGSEHGPNHSHGGHHDGTSHQDGGLFSHHDPLASPLSNHADHNTHSRGGHEGEAMAHASIAGHAQEHSHPTHVIGNNHGYIESGRTHDPIGVHTDGDHAQTPANNHVPVTTAHRRVTLDELGGVAMLVGTMNLAEDSREEGRRTISL